jgi:parallel beta-helix repeat protein
MTHRRKFALLLAAGLLVIACQAPQMMFSQMAEPTVTPTPSNIFRIAPDGSGDFASLEVAVADAPFGAILELDAGTYYLSVTLEISQTMTIHGAGMDTTTIIFDKGDSVLMATGPSDLTLDGITFQHNGDVANNVADIKDVRLTVSDCRFTGGVWDETDNYGGDGLFLRGTSYAEISNSTFNNNDLHGVETHNQAQVVFESSLFSDNQEDGITFFDESSGTIRNSESRNNGLHGIGILEQAQATVESSTMHGNAEMGLRASNDSILVARQNEIFDNGLSGIGVKENAQATLEDNLSYENKESGIIVFDNASGVIRGNKLTSNGLHGVDIYDQATFTVEANTCSQNTEGGIRLSGTTNTLVKQNECTGNGLSGIMIRESAQATLENNTTNNNGEAGIIFFHTSSGTITNNECTGNKWGIYLSEGTNTNLSSNNCHDNLDEDIRKE